jgi:hypothetical protein
VEVLWRVIVLLYLIMVKILDFSIPSLIVLRGNDGRCDISRIFRGHVAVMMFIAESYH